MNSFQKDIITIIHAALTGEKSVISDDFDLAEGIKLARKHNIVAIFYEGVILCGVPADNPLIVSLYSTLYRTVCVDMQQMDMIEKLTETFDKEHIDYMPLKGILLKALYPKSEMRAMGDADILIKVEQYPKITEILERYDFTFKYETDHELIWTNPLLFLELHKRVMTTYNKDFYKYFNTGWSLAEKVPGTNSRYEFKPEDFYIYIFVHFTKHYRISGIGIKHILDLWVYTRTHPEMNKEYISNILKQLKLSEFHQNVVDTLNVWFCGSVPNEKTTFITNVIFSSGQYGSSEMAVINRALRDSKSVGSISELKIKKIFKSVFMPYADMKKKYPVLQKLPFLFPVMWVRRIVEILVFRRKNMEKYVNNLKVINKSSINEHQRALNYVGLDFNFEE